MVLWQVYSILPALLSISNFCVLHQEDIRNPLLFYKHIYILLLVAVLLQIKQYDKSYKTDNILLRLA